MGCTQSIVTSGPIPVWSSRSTIDRVFHPIGPAVPAGSIGRKIRPNLNMQQDSGDAKIRAALRMTNAGLTFDTPVAIDDGVGAVVATANGAVYGNGFSDHSATLDDKRLVQFWIECQNDQGTALEMCAASVELDFQPAV